MKQPVAKQVLTPSDGGGVLSSRDVGPSLAVVGEPSRRVKSVDMGVTRKLPLMPAPSRPRRHKTVRRTVRAARLRRWLSFGPSHVTELAHAMQCTRYAIYKTLDVMPDVITDRGVVAMRGAA